MKLTATKAKEFAPCPEGKHTALCYAVIDEGTQQTKFGPKRQIRIEWEIPGARMDDGRPFVITKIYARSLHERSNLRKHLEAWRGQPFNDSEEFEIERLIGVPAEIHVIHETRTNDDGEQKTYANIVAIRPLPQGTQKPVAINETIFVSLEPGEFDINEIRKLSEYMQGVVKQSPEFQVQAAASGAATPPDSEIPF